MESRLPRFKPTLPMIKSKTSVDLKGKGVDRNMTKPQNNLLQATSSSNLAQPLTNIKNNHNDDTKCANENKMVKKQLFARTKSTSDIKRNITTVNAVKRPGTTLTVVDIKKSKVKLSTQNVNATKTVKNVLVTKNTTNKSVPNGTNNKAFNVPVNKWDYKTRFARANSELLQARNIHKDTKVKCTELEKLVNTLKNTESVHKLQIEEDQALKTTLSKELKDVKLELLKSQEQKENIEKCLKESEEALKQASEMLKEFQDKCAAQQVTLTEQAVELQNVKSNLESKEKLINELNNHKCELQTLVQDMDKERRVLHNTIQEMKGNIRVFCRIRPSIEKEATKPLCPISFIDECTIEIGKSDGNGCSGKVRGVRQEFSFDKIFPPNSSQESVFEELSLLVQSALEGYNVCVFAYGQTGSGKTYTMEGEPGTETEGMIPRTVRHIFKEMRQFQLLGWEYRIEASFLEIYNEHIIDLLDPQPKNLDIRMADSRGHDIYVSNLKIEEINNPEELHKCLITAQRNRAVAATQSNERSSRSHSVTRIRLIGTHTMKEEISIGNLNLVDLAGSERLKDEEAARTTETKNINKSLANLGNVILALFKKQEHIPYRNSKLTHLLMPSLGGNSKTLMLLNISPLNECYQETLNSLRFATNVNNCKISNIKRVRTVLQNN